MDSKASGADSTADGLVLIEPTTVDGATIAVVTLNRPSALNPLDAATIDELCDRLRRLTEDPATRAIVLTGAGSAFSAGGDLKGYRTMFNVPARFEAFMARFAEVCELLERSSTITAAMVNGTCVAGGLELVLACDLVTIADDARIGDGHLKFAQLPGAGASQRLVKSIGPQRARHWLYSGDLFDAAAAVEAGLAIAAVPREELRAFTLDLVGRICKHSPAALGTMKQLVNIALTATIDDGLAAERRIVGEYATTSDHAREGLEAFVERREPRYL